MSGKERLISDVYYNVRTGFGSIAETLKQVKRKDSRITRNDVIRFLNKQDINQKRKRNRYNSFVPSFPREQYQIDLADFGGGGDFRYAFVCIDLFTKMLAVVPMKSKLSQETSDSLDVVFQKLGHPVSVLTDIGGEFQGQFAKRLDYYSVHHIVTRTPPIFVERVIRTLRDNIRKRLIATRIPSTGWWRFVDPVVEQYNDTAHLSTGLSPAFAHENLQNPSNIDLIRDNIVEHARFNKKYPDISVGDQVKIIRKPGKYGEYKSGFVAWSSEVYSIIEISYNVFGQRQYTLNNYSTPLLRHELLKIEGAETPSIRRATGKQSVTSMLGPVTSSVQANDSTTPTRTRIVGKQTPSPLLSISTNSAGRLSEQRPARVGNASAPGSREVLDAATRLRTLHLERARLIREGNWPPRDPNVLRNLLHS